MNETIPFYGTANLNLEQEETKDLAKIGEVFNGTQLEETPQQELKNIIENNQLARLQALMTSKKQKVREYAKISRNDLCFCGSGKKYKNCCLNSGNYENLVDKK